MFLTTPKSFSKLGLLVLLAGIGHTQLMAKEPATKQTGTVCGTSSKKIYQSDSLNISDFDAPSRGLTLVKKQEMPQQKITMYTYKPGPVACIVKKPG